VKALIVYESMFGNTRQIAEAIRDGLSPAASVTLTDVAEAPRAVPDDIDLLVVGGPTHAFSMSRHGTREDAVRRGAASTDLAGGIREWLHELGAGSRPHFASFDTRVDVPLLPGAASRSAAKAARKLGFPVLDTASFRVAGYEGPVLPGETDRATEWAKGLLDARGESA
jgi:hypothetical protein